MPGSQTIMTNSVLASQHASSATSASQGIEARDFSFPDDRSTISANERGKEAYRGAMRDSANLTEALVQSASNINAVDVAWASFDKSL